MLNRFAVEITRTGGIYYPVLTMNRGEQRMQE